MSESVLESAPQRAAETLPGRTRFDLSATQWAQFQRNWTHRLVTCRASPRC